MLAQFVLIVFAMFAVLSLIIDVGYARLTQAQMQNAADVAALEGVRKRESVLNPTTGLPDAFASDCVRRAAANRLAHWVFDDDFDAANGDPDYQFGAGPIVDLTDGVTNLHALQAASVPDPHVYKPDLQLNQQNQVHGDMVSGVFAYAASPSPSEDSAYARNDFDPNPAAPQAPAALPACPPPDEPPPASWPASPGPALGAADTAFLVRLRRSNELADSASQTEPNVASSGPSLPLLFGRATTVFGDDPSLAYSPRRDGLTVRATAIAEIRPALHVGLPQPGMLGVAPFALVGTFVQTLNAAGVAATVNPANGVICTGVIPPASIATCVAAAPFAVGRFVGNSIAVSTVGQALPAPAAVACATAYAVPAGSYGPVYSTMASGTNRIIGFTRIGLSADPARANPAACGATIFRGVSRVASMNATASLPDGLPLPVGAQPCDVNEVLERNLGINRGDCGAFVPVNYAPVLVSVLAR